MAKFKVIADSIMYSGEKLERGAVIETSERYAEAFLSGVKMIEPDKKEDTSAKKKNVVTK